MCGWNIHSSAISWSHQRVVGLFVAVYRPVVPLSSIWLTLVPVAAGAVRYGVVLLKLDRGHS